MSPRIIAKHESEIPPLKRLGVIGGMGQWATLDILQKICTLCVESIPQYGNRGYPSMDIRMLNKAPMQLNDDGSYPETVKPSPELLTAAKALGETSDVIILTANTPHIFRKDIEQAAGKPFVSIVEVTVDEILLKGFKRVGLLGIGIMIEKGLFQMPLNEKGIHVVLLPPDLMKRLETEAIDPVQEGEKPVVVARVAEEALAFMRSQNVDGIILGCTELPLVLKNYLEQGDIIDPSYLLAKRVVEVVLG